MNDILYCFLAAAHVSSRLEPSGIYCLDGECPDGVTLVPWKSGKMMSGMQHAQTLLPPPMPPLPPGRQDQWQPRLRQKNCQVCPPGPHSSVCACDHGDLQSTWCKVTRVPERAGTLAEAGDGRGEVIHVFDSEGVCGNPERECGFGARDHDLGRPP